MDFALNDPGNVPSHLLEANSKQSQTKCRLGYDENVTNKQFFSDSFPRKFGKSINFPANDMNQMHDGIRKSTILCMEIVITKN